MIQQLTVERLVAALAALAPIDGVSVGTFGVSSSVRIDFQAAATTTQRSNAAAALTAFDWSDAASLAWEQQQNPNQTALFAAAAQAVTDNLTFLAIATPTQTQAVAQVQALTRQMNQVIRYLAQL
ncbi:MAG TPA: hypothetical protein VGQ44_17400 [Gemmatimonadaceae bacterium]|jgi:hypothetical protein|nr:hypothetical protein [Gemmatimonadaceae bacterium]